MKPILVFLLTATALLLPPRGLAHCDTLDGPVVTDAKAALEKADVTPVLKWVKTPDEAEIKELFAKTLAVRKQSPAALDLADRYFFETLVRVHRAAEGAPYTGLKPAGAVEPPIAAADQALATGKVDELAKEVSAAAAAGIRQRFARALEARKHAGESVAAGREYVEAYVEFVHYVERLHATATGPAGHGAAPAEAHHH